VFTEINSSFLRSQPIQQIEDPSVLNSVFFEHMRFTSVEAIQDLLNSLKNYIRLKLKGNSNNARLGFSTEKEMFNICAKLFKVDGAFNLSNT